MAALSVPAYLPLQFAWMAFVTLASPVGGGDPVGASVSRWTEGVAEVSIPNTRRIEFLSKVNDHRYSISVALPFESAPPKGYHVLYVLDGDWYFTSAVEAVRMLDLGDAPRVVVVGIGYPHDFAYYQSVLARRGPAPPSLSGLPVWQSALLLEREYDLTLPASNAVLGAQSQSGFQELKSENVGGLDDFLKIIETEVKPRVAALVPINSQGQALFGHSFGGLAALHALFVEPNAFRTFIIASPSIWWANRKVLADESKFDAMVSAGQASPHVLVTVGGEESTPPRVSVDKAPAGREIDPAAISAYYKRVRMVENGGELVARLKALHGSPSYRVEDYAVFDKETHSAAPWSALARGIPFAFTDQ